MSTRVARPVVSAGLWREIRKIAIDLGVDASDLADLGLRIVRDLVEKRVADDCLKAVLDHETQERLERLVHKAGEVAH